MKNLINILITFLLIFSPLLSYGSDETGYLSVTGTVSTPVSPPTGGVVINEVSMDSSPDWVEIFNGSTSTVDIQGWTMDDVDAATPIEITQSVSIPAGAYLVIYIEATGTNDLDFSDGSGTYYAGTAPTVSLAVTEDEVALYNSTTQDSSTIVDFVSYCSYGAYGGTTNGDQQHAIDAGIWTSGDYIAYTDPGNGYSIGLTTDGADNNCAGDWSFNATPTPGSSNGAPQLSTPVINPLTSPDDDGVFTVTWNNIAGATMYQLQEDTVDTFDSADNREFWPGGNFENITGRTDGTYYYRVNAWTNSPQNGGTSSGWSATESVMVTLPVTELQKASPGGEEAWRLNCGAENFDYTDPAGNLWTRDEIFADPGVSGFWRWGYDGGSAAVQSAQPVAGTTMDFIYQTQHWGPANSLEYKIEVPNGNYNVKLMFNETYFTAPGQRVFDVAIENQLVLDDHDIYAETGINAADEHTFQVTVNDQRLDITFPEALSDNPTISGIEVLPLSLSDDDFLDFIERKMFWYFWNETNPANGLISDREYNFAYGAPNAASIASTGYGLSILTIGAERGWITHQMALDRIHNTLDAFLDPAVIENVHGFWYHFMNLDGSRAGTSEISSIDSSIFIMGALQAGEYYRSMDPAVAQKAETLYEQMDWPWWFGRTFPGDESSPDRFQMNMGWKPETTEPIPNAGPEGGSFVGGWWNQYSESVFADLLAFGSPTHPVTHAATTWNNMTRNWVDQYGYHFVNYPALFTHQYHHLYYDMRDINDGFMNYYDNTVFATHANRLTCLNDPQGRYEEHRWGLTACDNPFGGYSAYGTDFHDGTVAPTAAVTSIIATPSNSIAAARYMYFQYKHHIWGRHGFSDSFNVQENFAAPYTLSLDNGAMAIAIENHRTGMVRDTFMLSPYVQAGLDAAGFKTYDVSPLYLASSAESYQTSPGFAFDGDMNTRWSSLFSDPQWIMVDYNLPKTIDAVTLSWESSYGKSYSIQVSNDGYSWNTVYNTTNGDGGVDVITFSPVTARFIRLYGTERGTPWGYSLYEMAIGDSSLLDIPEINTLPSPDADGIYTVSWNNIAGAAIYQVQEDTVDTFDSADNREFWPSGTFEDITGRTDGTYYYRVKAWTAPPGSGGTSSNWSGIKSITVLTGGT